MGDSNDIVYEGFHIDFVYIGRELFAIFGFDDFSYADVVASLQSLWQLYVIGALVLSFLLVIGIVYAYIRYNQMGDLESIMVDTQDRLYAELYHRGRSNDRWDDIQQHIASQNPNDWKLAIIEADVMLEQVLDERGYAGISIGEKLRSVSPASLRSLNDAWEAHKVRNKIAHEGADFVLTQQMARATIVQYGNVFREFEIV